MAQTATAAQLTLSRQSRPVTAAEAGDGAPSDGMVHDFFATSDADLLSVVAYIDVSLYQHPYGSDNAAPNPALVPYYPALTADSFLRMPSETLTAGGGFNGAGPERLWGDTSNDGPQTNFLFGRLTTTQTGSFSGDFFLRGETSYVKIPFSLTLPDAFGPPSEELTLSGTQQSATVFPAPDTQVTIEDTTEYQRRSTSWQPGGLLESIMPPDWKSNFPAPNWSEFIKFKWYGKPRGTLSTIPEPSSGLLIALAFAAVCRRSRT